MEIDRRLNLVIPVEDGGKTLYVYSQPLSRAAFEANAILIAKTFTTIYGEGFNAISGPAVAAILLRKIATATGQEREAEALLAEIRRLTVIVAPGESGFEQVPFEGSGGRVISEDDYAEVENAIVFFICNSAMHRRKVLAEILDGAAALWGGHTTSSSITELIASLRTSTPAENSGAGQEAEARPRPAMVSVQARVMPVASARH